jgi:hypothetical protein
VAGAALETAPMLALSCRMHRALEGHRQPRRRERRSRSTPRLVTEVVLIWTFSIGLLPHAL